MSQVREIRTALRAALGDVVPETETPEPHLKIFPGPTEFEAEAGLDKRGFIVRVIVGRDDDPDAQEQLDELLEATGEGSVRAALEVDDTLGGLVIDARVARCSGYRTFPPQDRPMLGADWTVEVLTEGGT